MRSRRRGRRRRTRRKREALRKGRPEMCPWDSETLIFYSTPWLAALCEPIQG